MAIRKNLYQMLFTLVFGGFLNTSPLLAQTPTAFVDGEIEIDAYDVTPPPTLAEMAKVVGQFSFPGGLAELHLAKNSGVLPQVQFGIYEPVIIEKQDHWRVLIGLSLSTLPGEYVAYVKEPDSDAPAYNVKFTVAPKIYTFFDVNSSSHTRSIKLEYKNFSELDFHNTNEPALPLILPIEGHWADYFGHMDNVDSAYYNSNIVIQNVVSLTTTKLANVVAPQNSIVSRIDKNELSQLATVFLDHGRGLYSIIGGIDNLAVELGDGIVGGAIIGRLPVSNDNSQPSILTWQCVLNNAYINPLILTNLD